MRKISYLRWFILGVQRRLTRGSKLLASNFFLILNKCLYYYARKNCTSNHPRLFVDVSLVSTLDHKTGIQRVVKNITSELYRAKNSKIQPIAFQLIGKQIIAAHRWLFREGLLTKTEKKNLLKQSFDFKPGDVLLMLDSSWGWFTKYHKVFAKARNAGVPIITIVYDLLPLVYPNYFTPNLVNAFTEWFHRAAAESDALLCISKAVADEVISYLKENNLARPGLKVGHWPLGADFLKKNTQVSDGKSNLKLPQPYFLMVGTIEPRKSHDLAIEAMDALWAQGVDINLCMAGKKGWMVDDLLTKIEKHPLIDKKLFLFEQPSDEEVAELYTNATAVLQLSKGEGFGLPLIEAAQYGVPVICSDIPVFREVAKNHATYINGQEPSEIPPQLMAWLNQHQKGEVPDSSKMEYLTWKQSAEALLEVTMNQKWYWAF